MVMPEGAPRSGQEGWSGQRADSENETRFTGEEAFGQQRSAADDDGVMPDMILDAGAEIFGQPEEGANAHRIAGQAQVEAARRHATSLSIQARADAEQLLSRARSHAESLSIQAHADAEELLSRAHVQAELLRVHAEAARAEAECLRAEAVAMRNAVRDDAEAAASRSESAAAQAHAAAEELRAAIQGEAYAARAELEGVRAEAASIRRVFQAEIGAALADAERMRTGIERLWAETDKLAVELRMLFSSAGVASPTGERGVESPPAATAPTEDADEAPAQPAAGKPAGEVSHPPTGPPDVAQGETDLAHEAILRHLDKKVAELLREISTAASEGASGGSAGGGVSGEPAKPSADEPGRGSPSEGSDTPPREGAQGQFGDQSPGRDPSGRPTWQPLIGSGGWHAKRATARPNPPDAGSNPPHRR